MSKQDETYFRVHHHLCSLAVRVVEQVSCLWRPVFLRAKHGPGTLQAGSSVSGTICIASTSELTGGPLSLFTTVRKLGNNTLMGG